ncbi:MAG TPA: hypothetical protein VFV99_25215 [Kofleriaceae bacterium]|nr:hypothetical protein [Kofleriaceae bacterium]
MRLSLALLACAGCSTYIQHRAALVPHATPVQALGQPAAWKGNATLGATNIADAVAPGVGDNPNAGVAIPSSQLRGALNLAVTRNLTIGIFSERGLASTAHPIKDTLPPLDDRGVGGVGYSASYSIPTGSPWRIGLALEMTMWRVPWVEYSQCIDFCTTPTVTVSKGTTDVGQIGFGIVPSYQFGDWTFFGGLTGRTHPLIEEKVINNGEWPDVEEGPMNAIVSGGAAYEAGERVQFVLQAHQVLTQDPVAYGPSIGFSVVIGLGPRYPKVDPPPPAPVMYVPVGATPAGPGALPPPVTLDAHSQAVELTQQARTQAQAGECDDVKAIDARVRALDPEYHATVFMRDALIAYCVAP